jgi:hypothetical protein
MTKVTVAFCKFCERALKKDCVGPTACIEALERKNRFSCRESKYDVSVAQPEGK